MTGGLSLRLTTVQDGDMLDSANRDRVLDEMGLGDRHLVRARQVHGATVARVDRESGTPEADALVSGDPGVVLAMFGADCPLLCLHDPDAGEIALVHAGWRGIVAGVVEAAAEHVRPVEAWIAAHAGPCCYEVGPEVAGEFPEDAVVGRHLNLAKAIGNRLGRPPTNLVQDCTICGRSYFSYRRDGTAARHALIAAIT